MSLLLRETRKRCVDGSLINGEIAIPKGVVAVFVGLEGQSVRVMAVDDDAVFVSGQLDLPLELTPDGVVVLEITLGVGGFRTLLEILGGSAMVATLAFPEEGGAHA